MPLHVPPLRERSEDIPELARHFLELASTRFGRRPRRLSAEAVRALQAHRWPGNVRELKNLIERLMIFGQGDAIDVSELPFSAAEAALPPDAPLKDARDEFERRYILAALKRHRGNVTRAAEMLGLERSNLHRKLKSYGIEVERE